MNRVTTHKNLRNEQSKKSINREITQLTTNIEINYPELCRSLDENPLTIPAINHPKIDTQIMEEYLNSLKQLLKHHLETHKNNNS